MEQMRWIPVTERFPEVNTEVLMSFDVFKPTCVGRYEIDDKGGAFYFINSEEPCMAFGYYVNAWMPMPKPYREEVEEKPVADTGWKDHYMGRFEKVE